jgi:hypothetical protein
LPALPRAQAHDLRDHRSGDSAEGVGGSESGGEEVIRFARWGRPVIARSEPFPTGRGRGPNTDAATAGAAGLREVGRSKAAGGPSGSVI